MKFGPVVQEEMSFKDISYLELWRPFCYAGRGTISAILVEGMKRNKEMRFKDISDLEFWLPLC